VEVFPFHVKKCVQILVRPPVRLGVRPQLLSTECDRRNLLLTVIVIALYNANVEQEAGQLLFAVAMYLFLLIGQAVDYWVTVHSLKSLDGGILDQDDRLVDVVDDREQV